MSDLFEIAKNITEASMSSSFEGQKYMLKKIQNFVEDNEDIAVSSRSFIISFLNEKEKEVQELIDQTPVGKIMKKVENEKRD